MLLYCIPRNVTEKSRGIYSMLKFNCCCSLLKPVGHIPKTLPMCYLMSSEVRGLQLTRDRWPKWIRIRALAPCPLVQRWLIPSVSGVGEAALTRVRDTDLNFLRDIQEVAKWAFFLTQRDGTEGVTVGMGGWVCGTKKDIAHKTSNTENNLWHTCWIIKNCGMLLSQVSPSFLSLIIPPFMTPVVPKEWGNLQEVWKSAHSVVVSVFPGGW